MILKLKKLREQKNLTQEQMAESLHISQNAYSLLENGKTKIDVERLFKIAEILEISPTDLLTSSDTIINFNDKVQNGYIHHIQTLNDTNKELVETLNRQLTIKDKQIEQLLILLNPNNG